MDIRSAQRLLLAAGYYKGGVDGLYGPKTRDAANVLVTKYMAGPKKLIPDSAMKWSAQRRLVAAGQLVLHFAGHEPGAIDGLSGHNTQNALRAWDYAQATGGKKEEIDRTPLPGATVPVSTFPRQVDCTKFYGSPGSASLEKELVIIESPYAMRLDYALGTVTRKIRLHRLCSDSALRVLSRALDYYGYEKLRELGLDRYAGAYNPRKMRGSNAWSMHAFGCAIDFYAAPNGLTTRCPQALFCGPAYAKFFDLWEEEGWVSLGRAIGRDWMHVQAARL